MNTRHAKNAIYPQICQAATRTTIRSVSAITLTTTNLTLKVTRVYDMRCPNDYIDCNCRDSAKLAMIL
jgi:hypothetical protein